jgi:hypothetical protein
MGNCECFGGQAPQARDLKEQGSSIAGYGDVVPSPPVEAEPAQPAPPEPAPPEPEPPKEPERVPKPPNTCPITLDLLQGDWVNSIGAKITVKDTQVALNGMVMPMAPVVLREDGTIASIGKIWQCKGWLPDDCIEFKEAPSVEVMEFARSVTWTPVRADTMEAWQKHMNNLGYAGSSSDVLNRGVEGCCPGTCDAKAKIIVDDKDRDRKELELLNRLITEYREPEMATIAPRRVVPDFSNRGHTGLSIEHVHYLAKSFRQKGFIKRRGNEGHDIPVLVRESTSSELGQKAMANWRAKLKDEQGFPPQEHYERLFKKPEFFTSLGNGHFNQALNLYFTESPDIYGSDKYTIGNDQNLKEAVYSGVSSVILKASLPLRDREIISKLLNSKREFKWNVKPDGSLSIFDSAEDMTQVKQFEAMSKVLDAVELNCLVRSELGVKESHRIGQ